MKKRILALLMAMMLLLLAVPAASAAGEWEESLYRFLDLNETMDDEEYDNVNAVIDDLIPKVQTDMMIIIANSGDLLDQNNEPATPDALVDEVFDFYDYGYGADRRSIVALFIEDEKRMEIITRGNVRSVVRIDALRLIQKTMNGELREDNLTADTIYMYLYLLLDEIDQTTGSSLVGEYFDVSDDPGQIPEDDGQEPSGLEGSAQTAVDTSLKEDGMPGWYPDDVSNFENFHGVNLPGVVDAAEILSDEEEAELSATVSEIARQYGMGYVIFTDRDNHGLDMSVYAADFLYFNGYGMGPDYSAMVLYLSLEEGNRGWRTIAIGDCEDLVSYDVINAIDDQIDFDIRNGYYYDAFERHAELIDQLYGYGPDYIVRTYGESTGRSGNWFADHLGMIVLAGLVIGLIAAGIYLGVLKKEMRVNVPVDAREYLDHASLNIRRKDVHFLYFTVTKTKIEKSSSSSSGSSFGSGHSSGGGSFSGGGRNF